MTQALTLRWLHAIAFAGLTTLAVVLAYNAGSYVLPLVSVVWGASGATGMTRGIRSAPRGNWTRRTSRLQSFGFYGVFALIVFLPALVTGATSVTGALGSAWLIIAAMVLTFRLSKLPEQPGVPVSQEARSID